MIKLKKTTALVLLATVLAGPATAYANSIDDKIEEQDRKIETLQKEQQDAEAQLAAIQDKVSQIKNDIDTLMADKTKEEQQLNELNTEIAALKEAIAERDERIKRQAVDVQTSQNSGNLLEAVLTASSLNEAVSRALAVTTIVGANNSILQEQQADKEKVEELVKETEERLQIIEEKSAELQVKQQNLVEAQLDQEVLINELQASVATEKEQKAKYIEQKEEAERKRQEQLRALEEQRAKEAAAREAAAEEAARQAATQAAAVSTNTNSSASNSTPTASAPAANSSGWASPVSVISVSSPFGWRSNPMGPGMEFHNGIDLVGASGTPIMAAKAGTVVQTGFDAGGGNYIIIQHEGGFYSHYLHLSSIGVSSGQSVSQGQVIGGMGTTGSSTGVHLHFGIGTGIWSGYIDPTPFIM